MDLKLCYNQSKANFKRLNYLFQNFRQFENENKINNRDKRQCKVYKNNNGEYRVEFAANQKHSSQYVTI